MRPSLIDVNSTVAGVTPLLRRLVGENIQLSTILATALPAVLADIPRLIGVIIDLAGDAREAMPDGGTLSIQTRVEILEGGRRGLKVPAGSYVVLAVTDTGHIAGEVSASLSAAEGTLQQWAGHVVRTGFGSGTTVELYFLPQFEDSPTT